MTAAGSYRVTVGSQHADLPIVPLGDDLAIALMMTIDMGVRFTATAGAELARLLGPARPECVASVATLGPRFSRTGDRSASRCAWRFAR